MNNALILLGSLMAAIQFSCSQQSTVSAPEKVLTALTQKFPNAKHIKWEKENDSEWEAEFEMNTKKYSANFNLEGEWMETESEIQPDELPGAVLIRFNEQFTTYTVKEVELGESPAGTFYEIELIVNGEELEVEIDTDGNLKVKKEEEAE